MDWDNTQSEACNNLGVMEMKRGNIEQARTCFESAAKLSSASFEPCFNAALLAFKLGDCETSFALVRKALDIYPEHHESKELEKQLRAHFTMVNLTI